MESLKLPSALSEGYATTAAAVVALVVVQSQAEFEDHRFEQSIFATNKQRRCSYSKHPALLLLFPPFSAILLLLLLQQQQPGLEKGKKSHKIMDKLKVQT